MINLLVALFAYILDMVFGEFRFIKHPIIIIGDIIKFFESRFYKDSILRGFLLVMFVLGVVSFVLYILDTLLVNLPIFLYIVVSSFLASMFLAHKMLFDAVKHILETNNKREAISMLVSRDTSNLNDSEIYKAGIETYAENLSDGVIAPLFYLVFFGLYGIVLYKVINTLDSMVGYKTTRYEKFGKASAKLDDIANFIPSRITAILIMIVNGKKDICSFYKMGKTHESPNAGHPITAMAIALDIKLGGDTIYFGKLKKKPYFGYGKKIIQKDDVKKALNTRKKVDIFVVVVLILILMLY